MIKKVQIQSEDYSYFHYCEKPEENAEEFLTHSHPFHELYINKSGKVRFNIEGNSFNMNAYDILLVPPYKPHRFLSDGCHRFEVVSIQISPSMSKSLNNDEIYKLLETQKNEHLKIPGHSAKRSGLPNILDYITDRTKDGENPYVSALIRSKIGAILYMLCTNYSFEEMSEKADLTHNVINFIDINLTSTLTVPEIVSHFNTSTRQLNGEFKKNVGITPGKYIKLKKLEKTMELYSKGHSLIHACIEAGFNSYESFAYQYKKEYGTSPKKKLS